MARRLGKYNHIRCQKTGLVLQLQSKTSGSPVIMSVPRDDESSVQLWYVDETTQTIRSKWKGYCLDHNKQDDTVIIQQYSPMRSSQHWVIIDGLIQTQDDFELVLGAPADDCAVPATVMDNDNSDAVLWQFEPRPAQFFFLRSRKVKHKVLDVEKAKGGAGTKVIVWHDKGTTADNQLWYEDQQGIIRSKLTDFAIDASGKEVVTKPYSNNNKLQQWVVKDHVIRNWHDPEKVIALQQGRIPLLFYDTVTVQKFNGEDHQMWTVESLPHEAAKYNHGCLGKYFYIKCFWNDIVLGLQSQSKAPGTAIITASHKHNMEDSASQLFYVDHVTGTIRDKVNDYCIEMSDSILVVNSYNPGADNQQWKVFGRKIQNRRTPSMVLTIQIDSVYENDESASAEVAGAVINCNVVSAKFTNDVTQQFEIEHIQARSVYIRNVNSGRVMDVYKEERHIGAKVIQWEQKPSLSENQLWYEDENGIIRSKMTGYVIQADESTSRMAPYDPVNKAQHWIVVGDCIRNKHDSSLVLDVKYHSRWKWMAIVSAAYNGGQSQKWTFDPI